MQNNTARNKTIAKNTLFLSLRMVLILVVSLYTSRVVLNTLGVEDYGVHNVVAGFISMFGFLNGSFTASIQRYYNYEKGVKSKDGVQKVYITSLTIQLCLAALIVLLVESFGVWYLNNKLVIPPDRIDAATKVFHFSVASMVFLILQIPYSSAIISNEKMNFYAVVGIVDVFLRLANAAILPLIPYDKLAFYGFLGCFASFVNFTLYFSYAKLKFPELKFKFRFWKETFKSMLSFSGWNIFGAISMVARGQGLNMILNSFFGPVVNAARGVSYQIQGAIMGFIQNISTAARPQLVESYAAGDFKRSKTIMISISKICFLCLLTIAIPVSIEINYILKIWLGAAIPDYTAIFTCIILATALVDVLNTPISMMALANGRIAKFNIVSSLIGLSVLPLAYVLLKMTDNPVMAYWASLLISCLIQAACIVMISRLVDFPVREYNKEILFRIIPCVFLSIVLPSIIHYIMPENFFRLSVVTIVSVLSVALSSCFVALNAPERKLVKQFILRK